MVLHLLDAEKIKVSEETFLKGECLFCHMNTAEKSTPSPLFFLRVILNLKDKFWCQNLEENILTVFVFQTQYTNTSIFSLSDIINLNYDLLIRFLSFHLDLFIIFQGTITQNISLMNDFLFQLRDILLIGINYVTIAMLSCLGQKAAVN